MMYFSPKGESAKISFASGAVKQVAALPTLAASQPAVRLAFTKNPNATWVYVNLGDSSVDVTTATGMPFYTGETRSAIIPVSNSETHIAIVFASGSAFDVHLTPGGLV